MQSAWKEDILRRAEASMYRRREEEAEAVRRFKAKQRQLEADKAREDFAYRVMFAIILAGFALALALKFFGVHA